MHEVQNMSGVVYVLREYRQPLSRPGSNSFNRLFSHWRQMSTFLSVCASAYAETWRGFLWTPSNWCSLLSTLVVGVLTHSHHTKLLTVPSSTTMKDDLTSSKVTNKANHLNSYTEAMHDSLVTPSGTLDSLFMRDESLVELDDYINENASKMATPQCKAFE
ncbi:hypothetical protein KIN20_029773 [Parelaphostrongylus tenuis]|uniref:Uncharacterized protein n=1 Tax=Parelaphostrongylus tenuis TaxID=148309 RepID=A0AAD5R2Y5_PARTN|nr:hypothetical protein KIN20_029773 [Parelaphostrongylus tenuis]